MNDRFRFNALLKGTYDLGDDVDVPYMLFVKDVCVVSGGDIGFGSFDLNKAFSESELSDDAKECIRDIFDQEFACGDDWYQYDGECDILQCTGLKDKNRKLIYGGDKFTYTKHQGYILESFTGIVIWEKEYACFGYKRIIDGNICNTFNPFTEHDELDFDFLPYIEVIGNIHENKELLK